MKESFSPIAETFGALEFLPQNNAASMSEGYNKGMFEAAGEWLIFCHDDIRILDYRADQFMEATHRFDVFGVCGTRRCQSANWYCSDPNDLLGRVVTPKEYFGGTNMIEIFSDVEQNCKAQALDGIFIAARATVAKEIRFSEEIKGFTCYDVDFSYRSHLAGYNVGVTDGILLLHESKVTSFSGEKMNDWKSNQLKIARKFNFHRNFPDGLRHHINLFTDEAPSQ